MAIFHWYLNFKKLLVEGKYDFLNIFVNIYHNNTKITFLGVYYFGLTLYKNWFCSSRIKRIFYVINLDVKYILTPNFKQQVLTKWHHQFVAFATHCLRTLQTSIWVPHSVMKVVLTLQINVKRSQKILLSILKAENTAKVASLVCFTCIILFAHTSNFNSSFLQGDEKGFDPPDKLQKISKIVLSKLKQKILSKWHH